MAPMTTMARSDIASAKPRRWRVGRGRWECMAVTSSGAISQGDGDHERVAVVVLGPPWHANGVLRLRFGDDVDARHLRWRRRHRARRITEHEAESGRAGIGGIREI